MSHMINNLLSEKRGEAYSGILSSYYFLYYQYFLDCIFPINDYDRQAHGA